MESGFCKCESDDFSQRFRFDAKSNCQLQFMKRILKGLLKGIVGMGMLVGVCYGGFHLWEFATGGKYVEYLKANGETIPLAQSFD